MPETIEQQLLISRPRWEVFDYLADACQQPAWRRCVKECRQIQLSQPGVGARYEVKRTPGALLRPATALLELCAYRPPSLLQWRRFEGPITVDIDCSLQPLGNETLIWYCEQLHGPELTFLAPFRVPLWRYRVPRDLWRLKAILEAADQAAATQVARHSLPPLRP